MRKWVAVASVSMTIGGACGYNPPIVPLSGNDPDVSHLIGEWVGEYESAETGRLGSIVFTLPAEADTAFGEVVMVPEETGLPIRRYHGPIDPPTERASAEVLTIRFVRIADHHVSGALDPYRDPACGCTLLTTFEGEHQDNRIEGTFVSRHRESGKTSVGGWWVRRRT